MKIIIRRRRRNKNRPEAKTLLRSCRSKEKRTEPVIENQGSRQVAGVW